MKVCSQRIGLTWLITAFILLIGAVGNVFAIPLPRPDFTSPLCPTLTSVGDDHTFSYAGSPVVRLKTDTRDLQISVYSSDSGGSRWSVISKNYGLAPINNYPALNLVADPAGRLKLVIKIQVAITDQHQFVIIARSNSQQGPQTTVTYFDLTSLTCNQSPAPIDYASFPGAEETSMIIPSDLLTNSLVTYNNMLTAAATNQAQITDLTARLAEAESARDSLANQLSNAQVAITQGNNNLQAASANYTTLYNFALNQGQIIATHRANQAKYVKVINQLYKLVVYWLPIWHNQGGGYNAITRAMNKARKTVRPLTSKKK